MARVALCESVGSSQCVGINGTRAAVATLVQLAGYWDDSIFLDVPFEVTAERMALRDGSTAGAQSGLLGQYVSAQRIYFERSRPWERAGVVVDNTNFNCPKIIDASTAVAASGCGVFDLDSNPHTWPDARAEESRRAASRSTGDTPKGRDTVSACRVRVTTSHNLGIGADTGSVTTQRQWHGNDRIRYRGSSSEMRPAPAGRAPTRSAATAIASQLDASYTVVGSGAQTLAASAVWRRPARLDRPSLCAPACRPGGASVAQPSMEDWNRTR